jgi:hypothetical protein
VAEELIWKVRVVKTYHEAHNHILIGAVRARDSVSVELHCRPFHFGRLVNGLKDVTPGEVGTRIIPWLQIEIINVLPTDFRFVEAELGTDGDGNIVLRDGSYACPIVTRREPRQ